MFSADVTLSGTGDGEAGLQISPWWSPNVDGRFNVRTPDGEVACFGGRLPFYSFTGDQGRVLREGDDRHPDHDLHPERRNERGDARHHRIHL